MTAWRPTREDVRAAEAAAHLADEAADAAGLLLADAAVDVLLNNHNVTPDVGHLALNYRAARMEAKYRWAAHADCLAQHTGT